MCASEPALLDRVIKGNHSSKFVEVSRRKLKSRGAESFKAISRLVRGRISVNSGWLGRLLIESSPVAAGGPVLGAGWLELADEMLGTGSVSAGLSLKGAAVSWAAQTLTSAMQQQARPRNPGAGVEELFISLLAKS